MSNKRVAALPEGLCMGAVLMKKVLRDNHEVRLDDFLTLQRVIDRYPNLGSETQWRWRIFRRDKNGLLASGAIVKRCGRWFFVLPRVQKWFLQGEQEREAHND